MKAACGGEVGVGDFVFAHATAMRLSDVGDVRLGRVARVRDDDGVADVLVHGVGVIELGPEWITRTVGGTKGPSAAAVERFRTWERGALSTGGTPVPLSPVPLTGGGR